MKFLNLSIIILTSFAITACFSSEKKIINKDNVARLPALGAINSATNSASANNSKITDIKLVAAVNDSEWQYNDYRGAENLALKQNINDYKTYNAGSKPDAGNILTSAPIIAEGKIYTLGGQGEIIARDVKNPDNIIWQAQASKDSFAEKPSDKGLYDKIVSGEIGSASKKFNGGNLSYFAGKLYITTKSAEIFVLNATTGDLIWQKQLNIPARTSPIVIGNKLIITTFDDETLALDTADGKQIWSHKGIEEKSKFSNSPSPLVIGNKVILSYSSGEVYSLDLNSGNPIWSVILGGSFSATGYKTEIKDIKFSPIYGNGKVFVVAGDGSLTAIDATTGQNLWTAGRKISSTPWYAGGNIFAVTQDEKLIAINTSNGSILFSKSITESLSDDEDDYIKLSGPVIANGKIYANDNKGNLFELSAQDAALLRTVSIPENVEVAPVIAGGRLYFVDQKSNLIILE